MTELVLSGRITSVFSHCAMYGLCTILDEAGLGPTTLHWAPGRPRRAAVGNINGNHADVGEAVRKHAEHHSRDDGWMAQRITTGPWTDRAVMSPRINRPTSQADWVGLQRSRHAILDGLVADQDWDALDKVGSLGEMAYWATDQQGKAVPERGATLWDMKTRNRGEELVGQRLHPLGKVVAQWPADRVVSGLLGQSINDEHGKNSADSRTSTGLTQPEPTDNALAWCAQWGLSLFQPIPRVHGGGSSSTPVYQRRRPKRDDMIVLPYFDQPCTVSRARTIVMSKALSIVGRAVSSNETLEHRASIDPLLLEAMQWLTRRNVQGVLISHVHHCGSTSAPERQVREGTLVPFNQAS